MAKRVSFISRKVDIYFETVQSTSMVAKKRRIGLKAMLDLKVAMPFTLQNESNLYKGRKNLKPFK